ncbi:MAG: tubulin-like doman-containing protein [Opitutaceae bacterium]
MKNNTPNAQPQNIQRALIIGIGGSGAETILGNRSDVIERYGSLEAMPLARYVYIDTDPRWYQEHQQKVEKRVRIGENEFVDIQFPGAAELYNGIRRGSFPNYSWFDVNRLENLKSVVDGAGTVRQLARLAFWHHYAKVRDAIVSQLIALKSSSVANTMRERYGCEIDDGINVHIIFGMAGGTGSGVFLDTAYLVRKILKDLGISGAHQYIGYGILPQAFKDLTGTNALANGYAALKELNYFSYKYAATNPLASVFGEPTWDADYLRNMVDRVRFNNEPPFDFCYLLDSRNAYVDLHRKDIYKMIDRAIFHEFTGSFATFKRSLRANVQKQITANDRADYPIAFMSFGQAAAQVPLPEIKQVLAHKLALQAVQQWIDKSAKPLKTFFSSDAVSDEDFVKSVVGSIRTKAGDAALGGQVREHLIRDFLPAHGLNQKGVYTSIVQEQQERLTDVPYAFVEAVKQDWIAERWSVDAFVGRVKDAWEKWRTDFGDESADRMQWGEQIRKLEANKSRALKTVRGLLRTKAFEMFEDSARFGPAWSVSAVRQLKSGLGQLKQVFIREAGDANTIATALGDVYIINAVTSAKGPSLSAVIEAKCSDDLARLDAAVRTGWPVGKRENVSKAAYQYLRTCAHWCRARVEERARRESAELLDAVIQYLDVLEEELIGHAGTLAGLEGELRKQLREWNQKATQNGTVGALLYDAAVVETLETKVRDRQGDQYSAAQVAKSALQTLGKSLRELQPAEVPALMTKLVETASNAIGDLNEQGTDDTEFAAHDILSAKHRSDDALDTALRDVIRKSAPYVRLTSVVEDGGWTESSDLKCIEGAGLRGGGAKERDPDADHARVIESLARNGWSTTNDVRPIDDNSQILFFKECGGFPLRALQGVQEMKDAYEQHRNTANKTPLHLVLDEQAERYPDLFPPQLDLLDRARTVQTVGLSLGFLSLRDFPAADGKGAPDRKYAFLRRIPELDEEQPVPLGRTIEAIGLKLATNEELLTEIERAIQSVMSRATAADKAKFATQLRGHLQGRKEAIQAKSPGSDPQNDPVYREERDRILAFIRKHGLVMTEIGARGIGHQHARDQEADDSAA